MDAKRKAKLNMFHVIIDLCEANLPVVALILAFSTAYNSFKTTVSAIVAAAALLEAQTGGFRVSKRTARVNICRLGSDIAGQVYAYAVVSGDDVLRGRMKITYSLLLHKDDEAVASACMDIYTDANNNIAFLADYGITAPILATFLSAINDYSLKSPKPRASRTQKKAIRAQMLQLFLDANGLLKDQMDKLLAGLRAAYPDFTNAFVAARVIVDPGAFATVVKIQLVHAVTGEPLRSIKSYIDDSPTFRLSTKKGFVTFKNTSEGNHRFLFKHKNFKDGVIDVVPVSYGDRLTFVLPIGPVSYDATPAIPGVLKGRAADANNVSLANTHFFLKEMNLTVHADSDGNFDMGNIPAGTYTLIVSLPGYQTVTVTVVIESGVVTVRSFQLIAI